MGLHHFLHSLKVASVGSFSGERVSIEDSKRALFCMQVFYALILFLFRYYPENFRFRWGLMCVEDEESGLLGPGGIGECLQRQVTLRLMSSVMVVFLLLIAMTLLNMGYFAMTKLYLPKLLVPLCIFFPSLALPDSMFKYIEAYGVMYALHGFVLGVVFVHNFSVRLNEKCVENQLDDHNNGYRGHLWRHTRHFVGSTCIIGSILGSIFLVLNMEEVPEEERGSSYDVAWYTVVINISVMAVITAISSLRHFAQGCYLVSCIMTAFLTTAVWGAVTYNGHVRKTEEFAPFVIIAMLWLLLGLAMSSSERPRRSDTGSIYEKGIVPGPVILNIGINDVEKEWDCYSEGHGVEVNTEFQTDPKPALRIGNTLLYLLYHLTLPAAFIALSSEALNIIYSEPVVLRAKIPIVFWALASLSWLGIIIFIWLLVAPFFAAKITKKMPVSISRHIIHDVPLSLEDIKNSVSSSNPNPNESSRKPAGAHENGRVEDPAASVPSSKDTETRRYEEAREQVFGQGGSSQAASSQPLHTVRSSENLGMTNAFVAPEGEEEAPVYVDASIPIQTIYAEPITTVYEEPVEV